MFSISMGCPSVISTLPFWKAALSSLRAYLRYTISLALSHISLEPDCRDL